MKLFFTMYDKIIMRILPHLDNFRRSILPIRVEPAGKERILGDWTSEGTGIIVHADQKRTVILTAAHVVIPEEIRFTRIRLGINPLSPNFNIHAKIPGGKEFTADCLPINDLEREVAFLVADTADIGEILPSIPIASEHNLSILDYWVVGYQTPSMLEGSTLIGHRLKIRDIGSSFFYLPGKLYHGYSGGPLFEANGSTILGIISGVLTVGSPVIYGPTYASIKKCFQFSL
ncbi:MAG: serine protease [Candidatus Margulisiibacteriota bacterium]